MQISNSAYVGVDILLRLAAHEPDRPCTAQALSEWTNHSMSSTETLMSCLRAAGLGRARRGPGGGDHLTRPADQITVAEIIKAFEEPRVLSRRPLNAITLEPETIDNLHGTNMYWEALKKPILLLLSDVSLADNAIGTVAPFADDQTDSSPAFGASMQSTVRH